MSTTDDTAPGTHPVSEFADRLNTRLDDLATTSLLSMSAREKRNGLAAIARAEAKLVGLKLRLMADAETSGACTETGAATVAAWMAVQTRQTRREARSDLKLALSLERHPVVDEAMAAGHVSTAQARVIVEALGALPRAGEFAVDADHRALAEKHLVSLAEHHDADELRVLGRRIFEVIAPDLVDKFEGEQLEAEEVQAARKTTFSMFEDSQGVAHGRFKIPARHAQMLRKAIQSLTNPTRLDTTAGSPIDPDLPSAARDGVAFTRILEAIDASWLPTHGGTGATVVVTMTLDQLMGELDSAGVCTMDTGGRISAGEARRLVCSAGIIPVVLGGKSVILDAGAKARFHTQPQRIVMGVRDRGCTAEGCDVPPAMCHAHHDIPFSAGGPTSVANGRLLCGHHHRRIHDPAYAHTTLANSTIAFHRRP
jgi:Domain of unknown function (DUF222)